MFGANRICERGTSCAPYSGAHMNMLQLTPALDVEGHNQKTWHVCGLFKDRDLQCSECIHHSRPIFTRSLPYRNQPFASPASPHTAQTPSTAELG